MRLGPVVAPWPDSSSSTRSESVTWSRRPARCSRPSKVSSKVIVVTCGRSKTTPRPLSTSIAMPSCPVTSMWPTASSVDGSGSCLSSSDDRDRTKAPLARVPTSRVARSRCPPSPRLAHRGGHRGSSGTDHIGDCDTHGEGRCGGGRVQFKSGRCRVRAAGMVRSRTHRGIRMAHRWARPTRPAQLAAPRIHRRAVFRSSQETRGRRASNLTSTV